MGTGSNKSKTMSLVFWGLVSLAVVPGPRFLPAAGPVHDACSRSFRSRRLLSTSRTSGFCPGRSAMRWSSIRSICWRSTSDRLLHTFRLNAGLPSSARPLGGWEEPKVEVTRPLHGALSVGLCTDVRQHRR